MFYKLFEVTGVPNTTVTDHGLVSTVDEKVKIDAIFITCNAHQRNIIEGWIGTKRILEIPDDLIDTTDRHPDDHSSISTYKLNRIPIDIEIPVGQVFKIAIRSGAIANNLFGSYIYTSIT